MSSNHGHPILFRGDRRVEKRGMAEVDYSIENGCQPNWRARTGAIGVTGSGSLSGRGWLGLEYTQAHRY
ncbi:hypothetical protein N7489_010362 [Penicillium chrysogenum]|uniref:uncharacterized protein n=1 Tax=Penicillium chrysogenum TaxID=5076 RepID=UPI0024DF0756|nr:uncharacterized protein N7489_010362 [Penicillium chrysogenum]KAJ5229654.1 hypothetical protein N7489_010362 [Penicillium chrysogenum]